MASQDVALLASFPLWPAFPTAEYYDASDADRASAADCWPPPGQPPTFTSMDSARRFRWRLAPLPIPSSGFLTNSGVVQVYPLSRGGAV